MATRDSAQQFDKQAQHYNAEWNQWSEESLRWLVEHSGARPEHRALDVATGTGFTAMAFASLVTKVIGTDVSQGMLAQARTNAAERGLANVTFQQAAAEALPFQEESFDLVTARVAPHHFLSVPKFVAESYRVLRPGGKFLVADTSVPDDQPEVDAWQNRVELLRDPSHMRNYAPSEWSAFVTQAGFVLEEVHLIPEPKPITLRAWLEHSGCVGEPAAEVKRLFADASPASREAFRISTLPDGDTAFYWMRVVLAAVRPR